MSKGEKLSLLVLRDNGVAWRCRMRAGLLATLLVLATLMPLLAGVGSWLSWTLWRENRVLSEDAVRLEKEWMTARATAERLSNLETLLRADTPEAGAVLQNMARRAAESLPAAKQTVGTAPTASTQEGPGHSEFPVVDTKVVTVENAAARLMGNRKLRLTLDLRNPDLKRPVSGSIRAVLVTADGESLPLEIPEESGDFRISRFKRAVLLPALPPGVTGVPNAMVIIEVMEEGGALAYRNIFPVER